MTLLSLSPWKLRSIFFGAGLLVSCVCGLVNWHWGKRLLVLSFIAVILLRIFNGRVYRIGAYFLGMITPLAVMFSILCLGPVVADYTHRREFNDVVWRSQGDAERGEDWPPRLCMVDDLISSGRLNHLTQSQVVKLLGPPHGKGFPLGCTECDIHYYLGLERGFIRIDSEWLFITFGSDGKVNRCWIYQD